MARGQEREIRGGELSPYVQQSLGRGRELAENRLVAAMGQAGATQRQQMEQKARQTSQATEMGMEAYQQAANRAQADKRAAEQEKANREERNFNLALEKSRQRFQTEENKSIRDHNLALTKLDISAADERHKEVMGIRRAEMAADAKREAARDNFLHSFTLGSQQRETALQKVITVDEQSAESGEHETELYNRQIDNLRRGLEEDTSLTQRSIVPELKPFAGAVAGMTYPYQPTKTTITGEPRYADPMKSLQKAIDDTGAKVSVENLDPSTIHNIKDQLRKKEIDFTDIRGASAGLDAILPIVKKREDEAVGKEEKKQWGIARRKIENMQLTLEGARFDDNKVEGQRMTVGGMVSKGLSTKYPHMAYNTRMMNLRNSIGAINEQFMKEIAKGIEPYEFHLLEIDPTTMSKHEIAEREANNNILIEARGKNQENIVADRWGAE